jgi:hypothetical protein
VTVGTRTFAALAIAACALTAACGVRTSPLPPEDTAARAPGNFKLEADGRSVKLSWERPTKTAAGDRLYDLAAFAIERRTGEGEYETIETISVTDNDRIRTQQSFHYVGAGAPDGELEYRVRAMTEDGEPGIATEALAVTVPSATGVLRRPDAQAPAPRAADRPDVRGWPHESE